MKKINMVVICIVGLVFSLSCSNTEEKANKLFVNTAKILQLAKEAEVSSYEDAYDYYNKVLLNLEEIVSSYPSSQIATKLMSSEAKIGSWTMDEFQKNVISQAKIKAEAEKEPLACSLLIANNILFDNESKAKALLNVAEQYIEIGQTVKAVTILSQAHNIVDLINDNNYGKSYLLDKIVNHYAKLGKIDKAFEIANKIRDKSVRESSLAVVAGNYAKAGQFDKAIEISDTFDKAIEISDTIEDFYSKCKALSKIASYYTEIGQTDKAFSILSRAYSSASRVTNYFVKAVVLSDIATQYYKAGHEDKALEIVSQALQNTHAMENSSRMEVLPIIAGYYAEAGQTDKTIKLLSETIEMINKVNISENPVYWEREIGNNLAFMPELYFKVGQPDKTIAIVNMITNDFWKAKGMALLAQQYTEVGQKDKANAILSQSVNIASEILDVSERDNALTSIAVSYAKAGQSSKALEISTTIKNDVNKAYILSLIPNNGLDSDAKNFLHAIIQAI